MNDIIQKRSKERGHTEKEHLAADLRAKLIETVDGARGRLEESCLLIGQVVDLVALLLLAAMEQSLRHVNARVGNHALYNIVRETTVHGDTTSIEVLTEESLAATAVEAVSALQET